MQADLERALAPLVGLPLLAASRASNMLSLQLGGGGADAGGGPGGAAGWYALHVFCAWRLVRDGRIAAASGDLFTPADPDEDLDTFDYDAPGAAWWDVRMAAFLADAPEPPRVLRAAADALGGVRLELAGGALFEAFPNSSPAEHFETEFWRLLRPGRPDAHVVVGTFGIDRVPDDSVAG